MLSRFRRPGLMSALTVSWMVLWVAIFPLVHVHPEADHAHGSTHHQHGGLAHSVLSQDLPCEFGKDSHHSSGKKTHLVGFPGHTHGHSHSLSHTEITFSALNPSSDGPLKKQFVESLVTVNQDLSHSYCLAWGNVFHLEKVSGSHPFINPYSSRPPPVLTI